MILTDESIRQFKVHLQQSVIVCSERCLHESAKWAAELLSGIRSDLLDSRVPFTQNDIHLQTISPYNIPYEASIPPLSEHEYNIYQYAKSLFQMRQFDSVKDVLGDSKSPKLYFLRLYTKYLAGEKNKEELSQEILGVTEDTKTENLELGHIYKELAEDYAREQLDAFGLYLYGIVLNRRKVPDQAARVLLQSVQKYPYNWSAWLELGSLVKNTKMFLDLQSILNREFKNNIMKDFFLAKLCTNIYQPGSTFEELMDPLTTYFPKSAYVLSQWAVYFYDAQYYNESSVFFEELHKTFPSRLEDMDVFSNLLYLLNSIDKLSVLALECAKIDKYRPETCNVIANYYSLKGDMPQSVEYFKRALKLDRGYHLAWTLLGHDYIELKNPGAAIECYRRAIGANSQDYRAWYGLGQAYEVMRLYYDALYHYQKATELRPNDERMWIALANCYGSMDHPNEHQLCLERAAQCDIAGKLTASITTAQILEKIGKMDIAIAFYQAIWQKANKEVVTEEIADISLKLAHHSLSKNRIHEAEEYAQVALNAKYPYHEKARHMLDRIASGTK
ncbi:anaphase promoting complex subunit 8 [Blakeslea trispora]|nr:anaphase promoting complex subunit 8 [Blakeslea trispora]